MNQQKPFLIRFSREPRRRIPTNQTGQTQSNTVTSQLRPTMVTDVRQETTDDK